MATPKNTRPWQDEPNEVSWRDPTTGLSCLIIRHGHMLHLCGYVGIPRKYNDLLPGNNDLLPPSIHNVHGGITYRSTKHPDPAHHVRGNQPALCWFGFDCAHPGDLVPYYVEHEFLLGGAGVYRDIAYVTRECTTLARALRDVMKQAAKDHPRLSQNTN